LDTLNLAKQLPLSYHHIFPFSLRSKTKASEIKEQVPLKVRKERALIFKNLDKLKRREFRDAQVGKSELVLVESGVHKLSGRRKGISGTYLRVLIDDSVNSSPKSLSFLKLSDAKNPWGLLEAK
jgi:threonylcarbamoyladenosine tRNA methylthiotransferase MtaB